MSNRSSPPAIPRRIRPKLAVAIVVLALVVLPVMLLCAYRISLWLQVKGRLDAIRNSGYPVTLAELNKWYPEVPPNENAATILTRAFGLIVLGDTNSTTLPLIGRANLPARGEPLPEEMKQTIANHLNKNRKAIELFHQAAQYKKCRYPVEFSLGINTLMIHLAKLKRACQLLSLEAALHAENNEPDMACRSILDSIALANSPKAEPSIISALVMIACKAGAYASLEWVLNRIPVNDDQLTQLGEAFQQAEESVRLQRAFAGDRCVGFHAFTLPIGVVENVGSVDPSEHEHSFGDQVATKLGANFVRWSGQLDKDRLYYLNIIDEFLQTCELPLKEQIIQANRLSVQLKSEPKEKCFIWSSVLLPNLPKVFFKEIRVAANLRATRTALAVERFRLAHESQLPESLEDLVPKFLKEVPLDPYDGKSLRYRKLAKGYVVYSIADNGRDDGGAEWKSSKDSAGPPSEHRGYDWTFTVER